MSSGELDKPSSSWTDDTCDNRSVVSSPANDIHEHPLNTGITIKCMQLAKTMFGDDDEKKKKKKLEEKVFSV